MKIRLALLLLTFAGAASAQQLVATGHGVVVAHDGSIELLDTTCASSDCLRWRAAGVENPTSIAANSERVIVLDALANEAVIADLASGRTTRSLTAETPVAATFIGHEAWVMARDARLLQRIGGPDIRLAEDPAFLAQSDGKLYVYSRRGALEEISEDRVSRRIAMPAGASDLEVAGTRAFLSYPREGRIRVVDLTAMQPAGEVSVGAVPVDVAIGTGGSVLTAQIIAVADPSAKRVWMTETTQSTAKAFARGFLRGLIGLGLYGNRSSQFPTGVDRVIRAGKRWAAFDSSTGTLYEFTAKKSRRIATGVASGAWTVTPDGVMYWNSGRLARSGTTDQSAP